MFPWVLKPSHEKKGRGMSVVEDAAPVDAGGSHRDVMSKLLGGAQRVGSLYELNI